MSTATQSRILWYWNRLACMTPHEVGHRVASSLTAKAERLGFNTARSVDQAKLQRESLAWLGTTRDVDVDGYRAIAEQVIRGSFALFSMRDVGLGDDVRWNRDPKSGTEVALSFSKGLNYRDSKLVGDIKYVWEINRHLQLVPLAQAAYLTGEDRYIDALRAQVKSWLDQCDYLRGPNWTSALELGIRLINWAIVWQLIGGKNAALFSDQDGECLRDRWLESIYRHTHFIKNNLSRHSSANNHLIGEAAGLYIATLCWPHWDDMARWRDMSYDILAEEALVQNYPDGVNREQAVWYQQFVLDFLIFAGIAARKHGTDFPASYWDRVERMLEFVASLMDVRGNVPMIGDADDGVVARLCWKQDFSPFRSQLATGAILFDREDFRRKAGDLDDKTKWLLGSGAARRYCAVGSKIAAKPARHEFPDGGYYILCCEEETENEIRIVVDSGPLGYLSIAAHGHADALSFVLSIGGREFLVDPGTYAYHVNAEWRNYFKGTAAHNTARVDQQDQSVSGGAFMWTRRAHAHCEEWSSSNLLDRWGGVHDGYQRLVDPVVHRRTIELQKSARRILITDTFECAGSHLIERTWHFSELCTVQLDGNKIAVTQDECAMTMQVASGEDSTIELVQGRTSPISGWISRAYDTKEPTNTVIVGDTIHGSTKLLSEFRC